MLIKNVDFPDALLDAQRDAALVVFAGAGVSASPPSNLPNFRSLVREVAADTRIPLDDDSAEPLDHFLGRLLHDGVKVHERVARILSVPGSKPNALHSDILRLFGDAQTIRLVTTNFDVHFTTAAFDLFGSDRKIEVYAAPALPLGHDFQGLVHLHASLNGPADHLVLTDADFGRAYLTQGWATRFLRELFSAYTVLFVGYSHDDPVMNYLARGLPPRSNGPQRFVITPSRPGTSWDYLGIVPITYQLQDGEDGHAEARASIHGLADFTRRGMIENEQKIKAIVEGPVPADRESLDYLQRALKNVTTVRFFTRYARTVHWLRWTESTGAMAELFKQNAPFREIDAELGFWFARDFICDHSGDALALLRRQGQNLSPVLSRAISHQLFARKPRPTPEILGRWIPLLLRSHPPDQRQDFLQYLLHELTFPDDEAIGLLLFGYLTKPAIRLTEKFWATEKEDSAQKDVDIELMTGGEDHWLAQAWKNFFHPNINTCGDKLLSLATSNLQEAYLLLRASGKTSGSWDPISSSRGLIESTGQGTPRSGVGILIDVVRELLEWNIENRPADADYLVNSWFASDFRLFQRLGIYGVSRNRWTPDEKLTWLLQKDLIYRYGFKHETFLVLQNSYPNASEERRQQIVERALAGPKSDLPQDTKDYETYNLLYWLSKAAPDCALAKARLDEVLQKHPDYGPRVHPDMDRWMQLTSGSWLNEPSPLTADELLAKQPIDVVDLLNSLVP